MVDKVELKTFSNAPYLNLYLHPYAQHVLQKLADTLGNGGATPLTVDGLKGLDGPVTDQQTGTGVQHYTLEKVNLDLIQGDLNSMDVMVADIMAEAATVSDVAQNAFTKAMNAITSILNNVPTYTSGTGQQAVVHPTVKEQFDAINQIDAAMGTMQTTVDTAYTAHVGAARSVPQPQTTGATSTGTGGGGWGGGGNYTGPYQGQAATAQELSGGQKVQAQQIYQYLLSKGFSPAQAAGILGNMQVESSLNTGAYNSAEGAIGLCQWEGGRRSELEAFAANKPGGVSNWKNQVDFMITELKGSEGGAYSRLMSSTTAGDAAAAFDQLYERSSGSARGERVADANAIAAQMANIQA